MLLNSKHHPRSSLESGDQRSPPYHRPASVASNLIRSEERKTEMRLGETGGQKADRQTVRQISSKGKWTDNCADVLKLQTILNVSRPDVLKELCNKRQWQGSMFSIFVCDKGVYQHDYQFTSPITITQTVWLSKASPHKTVEQHGGKTNTVHLKHIADHQKIFDLKVIFCFVLVRMNEWIWQDWS